MVANNERVQINQSTRRTETKGFQSNISTICVVKKPGPEGGTARYIDWDGGTRLGMMLVGACVCVCVCVCVFPFIVIDCYYDYNMIMNSVQRTGWATRGHQYFMDWGGCCFPPLHTILYFPPFSFHLISPHSHRLRVYFYYGHLTRPLGRWRSQSEVTGL